MHLWRLEYDPAIRDAQTKFCRRLIVVPLSTFHRMSELIGDPKGELIFLFNTARCGSTLLTKVSSRMPTTAQSSARCFIHFTIGWVSYANAPSQAALERSSQDVIWLTRAARRMCGQ